MKTWQQMLRENDPGAQRMDADTAARIRQVVVGATRTTPRSIASWPMRLALVGFACLVLMLSVFGTKRPMEVVPERAMPVAGTERRQIQFVTPGGTRIIWEINPAFTLGDALP